MVFNACSAPTHAPPPLSRPAGRKRGANSPIELCPSLGVNALGETLIGQSTSAGPSVCGRWPTPMMPCQRWNTSLFSFSKSNNWPVSHLLSGDSFVKGQSSIGLLAPLSTPAGVERGGGDWGGRNPDRGVKT